MIENPFHADECGVPPGLVCKGQGIEIVPRNLTLLVIVKKLPAQFCPLDMCGQLLALFCLLLTKSTYCQFLRVNATGIDVRHAEVEPLDHVGGVVSHFPLGQAISQVQLVCHVSNVLPSVSVSKQQKGVHLQNDVRFILACSIF